MKAILAPCSASFNATPLPIPLVAPVTIGKNAYVGAGSTITKDIPDNALGVGRSKQKNKENWSKTKK